MNTKAMSKQPIKKFYDAMTSFSLLAIARRLSTVLVGCIPLSTEGSLCRHSVIAFVVMLTLAVACYPHRSAKSQEPCRDKASCYACPTMNSAVDAPPDAKAFFSSGENYVYQVFGDEKLSASWIVGYTFKPPREALKYQTRHLSQEPKPHVEPDQKIEYQRPDSLIKISSPTLGRGLTHDNCRILPEHLAASNFAGPLRLTKAYYRPPGATSFQKVLGPTGLADIFVAYAGRQRQRVVGFWESRFWGSLNMFESKALPACNQAFLTTTNGHPVAVKSIKMRSPAWIENFRSLPAPRISKADKTWPILRTRGRMGKALQLMSAFNARYYDYIITYTFQDDGVIKLSVGATARNKPEQEFLEHLHIPVWRIDLDLGDPKKRGVCMSEYRRGRLSRLDGSLSMKALPSGNTFDRAALHFRRLHVFDDLPHNIYSCHDVAINQSGYRVIPKAEGSVRDLIERQPIGKSSSNCRARFFEHDAWLTPDVTDNTEVSWSPRTAPQKAQEAQMLRSDPIIWLATPILHVPRTEDGRCLPPAHTNDLGCTGVAMARGYSNPAWYGVATPMRSGVDLVPVNRQAGTPFYHRDR